MLVCRVATLVEHCDTYLWLLLALCWLFVNSGEVFPEFFSVGSGGGEVFPRTVLCSFLVVVALSSGLRDELSLLPVGLSAFSLLGHCRLRCGAFDRGSGRCAGQIVFLLVFRCFPTALHPVLVIEWFVLFRLEPGCIVLYFGWLLVLVRAPWVVMYFLIVSFVSRFTSLLGVGGVELSASETPCAGRCLVAVPLPLWGGCFAWSR
ncbi:hypothetical protein Taro_043095 [Colocasia esculenta]|uniref:Transmembrane protein n=1 Tax=Colocasia esculenta TaxID=4460 RepID=A0A843WZY8_COLES|nr:hypothetical protein [Colocasia esculenta]